MKRKISAIGAGVMALALVVMGTPATAVSTVTTIDPLIGEDPQAIAISSDGSTAIVGSDGSIQIIDTATNVVTDTISNGTFDEGGVRFVQFLPVPGTSMFLGNNGFAVISLDTDDPSAWMGLELPYIETVVSSVAVSSDGQSAWAIVNDGQQNDYSIVQWQYDPSVSQWEFAPTGPSGIAPLTSWTSLDNTMPTLVISPDDSTLYALFAGSFDDSELFVFDIATATVTRTVPTYVDTTSMAISPDGQAIIVTSSFDDQVLGIGVNENEFDILASANDANQIAFAPNSDYVYVTSSDHVHMISIPLVREIEKFDAGDSPYGLAVTPDGSRLYVTDNIDDGMVRVIALPTVTPVSQQITATVGSTFTSAALTSSGFTTAPDQFVLDPGQEVELPGWMSFDSSTGQLSGTPPVSVPGQTFQILAVGGVESAVATITLAVDPDPSLAPAQQFRTAVSGREFTSGGLTLSNFESEPAFEISPSLPNGLSLNSVSGVVSGTPTLATAETDYTITAVAGPQSASTSLSLFVAPRLTPSHQSVVRNVGQSVSTAAIETSGLPGSATFTISPALPTGLSLDASNGRVTGTLATADRQLYTITAASGGVSGTISLLLNVDPTVTVDTGDVAITAGTGIDRPLFTATGFPGAVTYSASPALPAGVSIRSDGRLVGTPTTASTLREHTVTASSGRWRDTASVRMSVLAAIAPSTQQMAVGIGQTSSSSVLTPIGFGVPVTYSIAPALPGGLTFDAANGRISGTAQTALLPREYTVTATGGGFQAVSQVLLSVGALTPASQAISAEVGARLSSAPLAATGFPGALRYSVAPDLPAWLSLNVATGALSGVPSTSLARTDYTITGTSGAASTSTSVTISVSPPAPRPVPTTDPTVTVTPAPSPSSRPTGDPAPTGAPSALPDTTQTGIDPAGAVDSIVWWIAGGGAFLAAAAATAAWFIRGRGTP